MSVKNRVSSEGFRRTIMEVVWPKSLAGDYGQLKQDYRRAKSHCLNGQALLMLFIMFRFTR